MSTTAKPQLPRVLIVHGAGRAFAERDERILSSATCVERVEVRSFAGLLRSLLMARRSDAVLCWFASFHAVLPALLMRLLRRPFVLVPGGYEVSYLPSVGYGWQGSALRRALVRVILRIPTTVAAVSPSIASLIRVASPGVDPVLIPNAFDGDVCEVLPIGSRTFDVATSIVTSSEVTRQRKGLDLFLAAARALPDRSFLLVGQLDWPDLPSNLIVSGLLPPQEAEHVLGDARVYVQATRGFEAFGSALLEAMAQEATPVVTEVGGMPWVVGGSGVVVVENDVDALISGIRDALANPSGAAARARVGERFGPDSRRRSLLEVLGPTKQSVISGGGVGT